MLNKTTKFHVLVTQDAAVYSIESTSIIWIFFLCENIIFAITLFSLEWNLC